MTERPLAETLVGLAESFAPPAGAPLEIEEARLDVPLEGRVVPSRDGRPVFLASLPHTRWRSGVLPPVQLAHVELGPGERDEW